MRAYSVILTCLLAASLGAVAGTTPGQEDTDPLSAAVQSSNQGPSNSGKSVINVIPSGTQIFTTAYDWGGNQLTVGSEGYHQVEVKPQVSGIQVGGAALTKGEEYVILIGNIKSATPTVLLYETDGTKVGTLEFETLAAKPALVDGFSVVVRSDNQTDAWIYVLENQSAEKQCGVRVLAKW